MEIAVNATANMLQQNMKNRLGRLALHAGWA
jgi:hypothetical protein